MVNAVWPRKLYNGSSTHNIKKPIGISSRPFCFSFHIEFEISSLRQINAAA